MLPFSPGEVVCRAARQNVAVAARQEALSCATMPVVFFAGGAVVCAGAGRLEQQLASQVCAWCSVVSLAVGGQHWLRSLDLVLSVWLSASL